MPQTARIQSRLRAWTAAIAVVALALGGSLTATAALADAPSSEPTLSVSKTAGLDPAGESITVTGTNYSSDFVNRHGVGSAGVYVQIGYIDPVWKPSESAPSDSRNNAYQVWAQDSAGADGYLQWTSNGDKTANFSWTVEITKATLDGLARDGASLAVYTVGGGGVNSQPINELAVPISFAAPAAAPTALSLTSPQGTSVTAGTDVTITATVAPAVPGSVTFSRDGVDLATVAIDGSGVGQYTARSLAAGSATFAARFSPTDTVAYQASSSTLAITVVAPPVTVRSGSLTWGVKADFRSYITGPIASGTIITSGVSTSGGTFIFPQAAGSTFDATAGTGTVSYSGSVRFYGHAGALDVTLKNPMITVSSASSGTLSVTTASGSVALATLNLAAASKSTSNGAVSYSAVPTTLAAQGVTVFAGNYPAGSALDSLSFVIGSAGSDSSGTKSVAAFAGERTPPASPPATTGATLTGDSPLSAGGEVTITASGYAANETGIMIVIYSAPVILAKNLTADAQGIVTWTGRLPDGLTGEHTLTVQGSVARGIVLNIPATLETAAVGCPASAATLDWGFKESFRSYISGSIANGSWTTADGASYATPLFAWSAGDGVYDVATGKGLLNFTGSVTFTGHDGALNTTIANPQIEFVDAKTAYLLLDVSGVTQDGQTVSKEAVRFAELTLPEVKAGSTKVSFNEVPAVLTAAGSDAFGTYPAGEQLDPVTIRFASDSSCAAMASDVETVAATPIKAPADLGWVLWVVLLVVLAAIAGAAIIVLRRRRA